MKIGFYVSSGHKGTLLSVANKISIIKNCEVWILARDTDVFNLSRKLLPNLKDNIIDISKINPVDTGESILDRSLRMEDALGHLSSMLMSYERSIGQGYLSNADRHPHVIRSLNSHEEKLSELVVEFEKWEAVLKLCDAKIIFGWNRPIILSLLVRAKGGGYISFIHSRIGNMFMLVENHMLQNANLIASVKDKLCTYDNKNKENIQYEVYESYSYSIQNINQYLFINVFKKAMYICIHEIYKYIRGYKKIGGYVFCGWALTLFRKAISYKYWEKYGVSIDDMREKKTVIFPLHFEPEISLMHVSPEFSNSYEIICWVSKNLPADVVLVVKENPRSFGIRSREYYDRLRKISNVELAQPDTNTKEWINHSLFTVAISGTSGFESVYYDKPVLSYGKHQIINYLPTVYYVSSFLETRATINELLCLNKKSGDLIKSKTVLHNALMSCSFSLPKLAENEKSDFLVEEIGAILADRLYNQYVEKI
jgi:hypothetical protein